MKYVISGCVLALSAVCAQAADYGRVISSVPVIEQVATPHRTCWEEDVVVRQPSSGGGAILGGIFGALVGNSFGRGSGNAAATAAGAVVGAMAGSSADRPRSDLETVRRCETSRTTQHRTAGYDVTYEYAGQRYTTRMATDPGEWVPIRVSVDDPAAVSTVVEPVVTEPVYTRSRQVTVVEEEPIVVYRRAPAYVPPVYIGFDIGYRRGWGDYYGSHWHHR